MEPIDYRSINRMLDRHKEERHEEEEQERFFREMAAERIACDLEREREEAVKKVAQ